MANYFFEIKSANLSISVEPFMSNGYLVKNIELYEELGGSIAKGKIQLVNDGSNKALELITNTYEVNIILKKKVGVSYEIKGYIDSRSYHKNFLNIHFLCVPNLDFLTKNIIREWDDIDSAIETLWTGKKDIRCNSDIGNGIKILQASESDKELCSRLALSYKKNTIFAFGLEGFLLKDTIGIDSTGKQEPYWQLDGEQEVEQDTNYIITYNYNTYLENYDPFEGNEETGEEPIEGSKNIKVEILDKTYRLVHKDYGQLLDNYKSNKNFIYNDSSYNSLTVTYKNTLPEYKLGDVIYYRRVDDHKRNPMNVFLVKSMNIYIEIEKNPEQNGVSDKSYGVEVTSKLWGLKDNGELLSNTDPTKTN